MGRNSRREFIKRVGQAGLVLGLGSNLGSLAGCDSVNSASGRYDVIIIGGGTAGTIVAAKLQAASGGRKRILIIEAGGPTAASIGGTDYPEWLPPDRNDLTIFDVPGQYSQIPFTPAGAPYQLTETPFHISGHRPRGEFPVQRNALPDEPAARVQPLMARRMGMEGHGPLLQTHPAEYSDNKYPVHERDTAEYRPCRDRSPALRKHGLGGDGYEQAFPRGGRVQQTVRRGRGRNARGPGQRRISRRSIREACRWRASRYWNSRKRTL